MTIKNFLAIFASVMILMTVYAYSRDAAAATRNRKPVMHHALLVKHPRAVDAHIVIPPTALKKRGTKSVAAKPHPQSVQIKATMVRVKPSQHKTRMFTKAPPKPKPAPANFLQRLFGG